MGRNSFSLVIRLIAGGYIAYLGYNLVRDVVAGEEETSNPTLFMIIGIVFIILGAFIIIDMIRKQMKDSGEEEDEETSADETAIEETEEEAEQEEAPAQTMSIAERIRRLSEEPGESEAENEED